MTDIEKIYKEYRKKYHHDLYISNREVRLKRSKDYYHNNKEKIRQKRIENRVKKSEYDRQHYRKYGRMIKQLRYLGAL